MIRNLRRVRNLLEEFISKISEFSISHRTYLKSLLVRLLSSASVLSLLSVFNKTANDVVGTFSSIKQGCTHDMFPDVRIATKTQETLCKYREHMKWWGHSLQSSRAAHTICSQTSGLQLKHNKCCVNT